MTKGNEGEKGTNMNYVDQVHLPSVCRNNKEAIFSMSHICDLET